MDEIDRTLEHALAAPFPIRDIEWRVQASGKYNDKIWASCLVYVTNRAIMHRLDECVGVAGWKNEVPLPGPCDGLMQGLTLRIAGEWITKWDGASNTQESSVKGGLSGAMKRAAVQWGIGRYLYRAPNGYAVVSDKGQYRGKLAKKDGGDKFKWDPPKNMLDFVMDEYEPDSGRTAKPPAKAPSQKPGQTMSETLNGFIDEMDNCTVAEMRAISQRIRDSVLEGDNLQILRDAKETRLAQIDIDADN
jgi:hypothetical protein